MNMSPNKQKYFFTAVSLGVSKNIAHIIVQDQKYMETTVLHSKEKLRISSCLVCVEYRCWHSGVRILEEDSQSTCACKTGP